MKKTGFLSGMCGVSIHRLEWLIVRRNLIVAGLLCGWLMLGASGCKKKGNEAPAVSSFHSADGRFMLAYAEAWMPQPVSMKKFMSFELGAVDSTGKLLFGEAVDYDAVLLDVEHICVNYLLRSRCYDLELLMISNKAMDIASCPAVTFYGLSDGQPARGWFITNQQNVYYLIAVCTDLSKEEAFFTKASALIDTIEIKLAPTVTKRELRSTFKIAESKDLDDLANNLAYGNNLLKSRDVSVDNYERALQRFRSVLIATYDQSPRPPEYAEAVGRLDVTNNFRQQAFMQWQFLLEQNLGMGRRVEAMKYARLILQLYPLSDSPFHVYASEKLSQASGLNFNN
ncbi:MAG: hypothetical protein EOL87_11520 [Spartobacteria bacterium]|nr:hypothetical protein [Spartobacteria bacterium]